MSETEAAIWPTVSAVRTALPPLGVAQRARAQGAHGRDPRHETERDARGERQGRNEREDAPVDRDLIEPGQGDDAMAFEELAKQIRDDHTACGPCNAKHDALGE